MTETVHKTRSLQAIDGQYQEVTADGTVKTLTLPAGTYAIRLKFTAGPVNFTLDGSTPTTSFGITAYDGEEKLLSLSEAVKLKFTRQSAVNGLLQVTPYAHP